MIKFSLRFDKDTETKWLNEMADQGYAMTGFFAGFYTFEKCEPGEYSYQIDMIEQFGQVPADYKAFMEDTGAEIVQNWGIWVYLRKRRSEGEFQLYTDVESMIEHYTKIRNVFKVVTAMELVILIVELFGAMLGSPVLWIFVFLIGAVVLAFMNQVVKLNGIIAELKERRGEAVQGSNGRNVSAFLPVGLLFNSCALTMTGNSELELVRIIITILAISFMLLGIVQTVKGKKS
ncbi:MAG: DUF2812 domain-containing protein [Lachnospiraceae bacterium]|nr:DUF2812 domain-containing protein [Lachnospiraceae bacterium]